MRASYLALLFLAAAPTLPQPGQAPQSSSVIDVRSTVRIHHVHFRVPDPAAAIQTYADRLGGGRVVLAGIGAGVRFGGGYLLFERGSAPPGSRSAADRSEAAYRAAAPWLLAHGVAVQAGELSTLLPLPQEPLHLDHVAFSAADYEGTVDLLAARGAPPTERSPERAMFALSDGSRIEIVRERERVDAYWCPMHPDVRSAQAGSCPLCAMALVEMPPPRVGDYRMDLDVVPRAGAIGLAGLRLLIRDPERRRPVSAFSVVHERLMHLFIISRSLDYFAHVHPDLLPGGAFRLRHDLAPGEYVVIADFLPKRGASQMLQRAIVAPGPGAAVFTDPPSLVADIPDRGGASAPETTGPRGPRWGSSQKTVDGVTVRLEAGDLLAGRPGLLRFTLTDAVGGAPVADLEPYLGAQGHLLLVSAALTDAIHGHPEGLDLRSPVITFLPLLPKAGMCKLWVQFQRAGRVITVPFVIEVARS